MPGRGGAGNIIQAQEQSKRVAEDVEANLAPTTSTAAPPLTSPTSSQPYAYTGRGGAGNWYQPSQLAKEGTFSTPGDATALPSTNKPNVSTPWHPESQQLPVARAGRGGAGNFVWKDEEVEKERRQEEERRKGEVSEGVERSVEQGLTKPGAVVLGGVKAGRGW